MPKESHSHKGFLPLRQGFTWVVAVFLSSVFSERELAAVAQDRGNWNEDRVIKLIERARTSRRSVVVDTVFTSYQTKANGHIYFFLDRPGEYGVSLIKADQVALEAFWEAPNATAQRIIGRRDDKLLPTNVRYHLDHLTLIQDDFGDLIRMGDGDEVEAVPHPLGPGSAGIYDFLLADSLTISYSGGVEEVRVYEISVRPQDFERPGFVGTVYLDQANAAVVRMSFSFTPASYVDDSVDYIRISLDNSLWLGKYWLPNRQEVEIRRETPVFDLLWGSIIRSRFEISEYDFNPELPASLFRGGTVDMAPPDQIAAFTFESGLFDALEDSGLEPTPSLRDVRSQVGQIVGNEVLSGLKPLRLYFGALSDVASYNRAEGFRVGAGLAFRPEKQLLVRTQGRYALSRQSPSGALAASTHSGRILPQLDLYWDELGDIGGHPGAERFLNTISALSGNYDFIDPFFRRGATLTLFGNRPNAASIAFTWEEHRSANNVVSDDPINNRFRPILSVDEGSLGAIRIEVPTRIPWDGRAQFFGELGRLGNRTYTSLKGEARWEVGGLNRPWHAQADLAGGFVTHQAPVQSLHLLGGRNTLPGHDYRAFAGHRYWLLRITGTQKVYPPHVGIRFIGALGSTFLSNRQFPADWIVQDSRGVRASVGLGLALGWDTLRLDVAHGISGGGWEAVISVDERFRDWL